MQRIIFFLIINLIFVSIIFSEDFPSFEPAPKIPPAYIVGTEDVLEISVWGYDDLKSTVRVRSDGRITYAMLGEVVVSGLTTEQIKETIALKLRSFIHDPQVNIEVKEFNSRKVLVLGAVPQPGPYTLIGSVKLLDILIKAGWSVQTSKSREVSIMREDGSSIKINLNKLLVDGEMNQNIELRKNDTIFVPEATRGIVYIEGEVAKTGEYKLENQDYITVSELLRQSGGITATALREKCKIVRKNGQEELLNLASLLFLGDQSVNYKLYDGDKLVIPRVQSTKIYVIGEAEKTGIIDIDDPYPTMIKLLSLAKDKYFGILSDIKVVRDDPDNPGHPIVFNIDAKKVLYQGDISQNIKLENRDVVFIPQSFIGSFTQFLQEVWPSVTDAAYAIGEGEDIVHGDYYDENNDNNNNNRGNRR